jgi:non-ribosomal peptide synthetase component F
MVVLQNIPLPPLDLPGLSVTPRPVDMGTVKFDMALVWWEEEGRLAGQLEYSTVLFDAPTMQRLLVHYETVLARGLADPDLPISVLAGPTEAERHQIVEEWNDSRIAFRPSRCIHQWMEEQVAATPDALALIAGETKLSYRELNAMANRLESVPTSWWGSASIAPGPWSSACSACSRPGEAPWRSTRPIPRSACAT